MAVLPFSLVVILLCFSNCFIRSQSFDFAFNRFNQTSVILERGATIKSNGALELTNSTNHVIGHAFFPKRIPILNYRSSGSPNVSSFSTYFVFMIAPPSANKQGGHGFAFILSPSTVFIGAKGDHYLGILNSTSDGKSSNQLFIVEFDTVNGHHEDTDTYGNHIGVNLNSMNSEKTAEASYYGDNRSNVKKKIELESGEPIQAWIEFDGFNGVVNVTIAPLSMPKPIRPLISEAINLSSMVQENMYAGFSAATGLQASSHYILGWSFRLNGAAASLDASRLPIPEPERTASNLDPVKKALIVTFAVLLFIVFAGLISLKIYRWKMKYGVLEDWEMECPHRFRYEDLYAATKGFRESELIGVGGFGEVYKGVLPTSGAEVAVKKISNKSLQGIREFAAEIESLGRLRHKHLVNLQGWCKYKNDLLIVYEYIPNGSLDCLLYSPRNNVALTWEQRFNIIKGVAAGLLYLHEEWEKVVIHRDVKSSNVLIDRDLNARLGDFGLARLYDHDKHSHTTNVVGTIGYIAPELTRIGKASTNSDVFAYGILLLEIACGRPPISYDSNRDQVVLVDWVIECLQLDRILDAVDPKLNSIYVVEEMELVLGLGLLCSHPKPEARPTLRQVLRYLNGDEVLPVFDKLKSVGSRNIEDTTSGYSQVFSTRIITASFGSSSSGEHSPGAFSNDRHYNSC